MTDGHLSQDLPRLHLNLMCVASEKLMGDLVIEVRTGENKFVKFEIKLRRVV